MKAFAFRGSIYLVIILVLSLCMAQGKDAARVSGGHSGPDSRSAAPAPASSGEGAGVSTRTTAAGSGPASGLGTRTYEPDLNGTSFATFNSYYAWINYYSYLSSHFDVSPIYFDRFSRNTEPLITPAILKLTLREPISLSSEMLDSINQLQEMVGADLAGTPADRQALAEKSRHIRKLAKQIRQNQTLSYFDLRENKDFGQDDFTTLSPEAMQQLRRMATDLDRQLRSMYRQSSTSTVSVDSYKEPSLESLAKGIEKICKAIETQSKKL